MISAFRAKQQQFFFKNVCVHTEIRDSVFLSRKKLGLKIWKIFLGFGFGFWGLKFNPHSTTKMREN
jgi:hypothetical protein